jgi:hypothetical protein
LNIILKLILPVLFGLFYLDGYAQDEERTDTLLNSFTSDTTSVFIDNEIIEPDTSETKIHLPRRATMLSAVLPGLGQIYNKQALKVPFIYAGFAAWAWGIQWNQSYYIKYRKAYFDLTDGDPTTTENYKFIEERFEIEIDENNPGTLTNSVMQQIERYNRQRSLVMIGTAAFYILNILDANVAAHFIDFDISEDLTYSIKPIAIDPATNTPVLGVSFAYNF